MSKAILGTLTIGQAPRADITPILDAALPAGTQVIHAGVCDGLSREEIARRFPVRENDAVLTSRLLDGSAVTLGKPAVRDAVVTKLAELEAQGCTVIALLCTGEFHGLACKNAWLLEPDQLVPPIVAKLVGTRKIGVMVPLEQQVASEHAKWIDLKTAPCYGVASPYESSEDTLRAAALSMKEQGAQVIVMDCMGYTEWHRARVMDASGLPVIISNALLARLLATLL